MATHFRMFSVIFETWVARAGKNLFLSAFHLYMFPYWGMSAHQVTLFKMLHLREVIASSFVTWPVLVSKTEGVETDSGRQHSRLCQDYSTPSCSYGLHHLSAFLLKWWCRLEGVNL